MLKKNFKLGIIDPTDFSDRNVSGGSSGFLCNIFPYLNAQQTIIFGIGLNDTIPWQRYHLLPNVEFIPICNLKSPSKIPMRLKVLINYMRYRKRIINSGVDILYIHAPECCLVFLKNSKGIPVIYHKHGSANPVSKSKYFYGRSIVFIKFYEYVLKLIYRKAQWIIAIDRLCLKEAVQNGAEKKTSLLMNAVDINRFYPHSVLRKDARKQYRLSDKDISILFVGRIEKPKGPEHLLDCIPFLKEEKYYFHIFLAGEGTYKQYLQKGIMAKGHEQSVTFLGNVKHKDLPYYYNMADVLVLPSEMEGVPMVILESLACGTPVVASNVGGIPDVIDNKVNGILVDDLSARKLTDAIVSVLSMKLGREKVSNSIESLSVSNFIESFDNIILDVIRHKK